MNLGGWRKNAKFLRSRVARRIFALFLACAVVPLGVLGFVAVDLVTTELTKQSHRRLHESCVSLSRLVLGRFELLEIDLRWISNRLGEDALHDLQGVLSGGRRTFDGRFEALTVVDGDGTKLDGWGEFSGSYDLTPEQRAHLAQGNPLIRFRRNHRGFQTADLAIAFGSDDSARRTLWGAIRRDHLWGGDWFEDPGALICALTESGDVLFADDDAPIDLAALKAARTEKRSSGHLEWAADGDDFLTSYRTVYSAPVFHESFVLAQSELKADALAPVSVFNRLFLLTVLLTFVIVALLSLNQIRRNLVPIEALKDAVDRFKQRDYSARVVISSRDEFKDLGDSFNEMIESLDRHVTTLEALNEIGVALTAQTDPTDLIRTVVSGARRILSTDAIALYLADSGDELELASLPDEDSSNDLLPALRKSVRLDDGDDGCAFGATVARTARENKTFAIEGPLRESGRVAAMMTVPLNDHEGEVIGVLVLLNALGSPTDDGPAFSAEDREVAASLASQAAVAITKNDLVQSFRALFDSLTEMISQAIDEKSPYTGGHCRRVPVLTMMLADAACGAEDGRFRDFSLTDDELYELKTAAQLHDCGKVTTPVHVVDKATKLETLYDRIGLLQTRFELLKRDAELAWLRARSRDGITGEGASGAGDLELKARLRAIDEDRRVIEHWNVGGEFMAEEAQEAIKAIAKRYTWRDHEGVMRPALSAEEVDNLCIARGTLNSEEREIINDHVSATIRMLEKLPYPKSLKRVPEIAGAHHERMDGKGYPLGLKKNQLDVRSRILGLADVFEALTAKDRPYKPGKTLKETLQILGSMSEGGHIDSDLFQLFVETGTYLTYAQDFLDPEQIDDVDHAAIPGYRRIEELSPSAT